MFEKSAPQSSQTKILVHFVTTGDKAIEGEMHLPTGQTFAMFMNGGEPFVEVETSAGETRLVARNSIIEAREIMPVPAAETNPYAILRIQKGASLGEVKEAWKRRMKACHPDRIAALDLDSEIVYAARRATQKINTAYDEIISAMRAENRAASMRARAQSASDSTGFSAYF